MWALAPGDTAPVLRKWAQAKRLPEAILVISPHWMTRHGVAVMTTPKPETWHDFGGFPEPLYQLQYPATGAPIRAQRALELLQEWARAQGWSAASDPDRPLDHGAWVPLRYLYPDADVPVFQVSLPLGASPAALMDMGRCLRHLRDEGVLILTTGSMTHNLIERNRPGFDLSYVSEFAGWVRQAVESSDVEAMLDWKYRAPSASRAHPSDDHFVPLFIAMGAAWPDEQPQWLSDEIQFEFLAMDAVAWGGQASA